jgi:membrane fusion protein, multidrug efflux system
VSRRMPAQQETIMSNQENREPAKEAKKSARLPTIVLMCVLAGLAAFGIYYFAISRNKVETDDAYVNGNLVRLTPQVSGTVIGINTDETQFVQRGQVLVELDPHDTEVALAQARASLGQTVRDVAQLFAQEARDAAAVTAQQTLFTQTTEDLERDRAVFAVHGVSDETLKHDENAVRSARAALDQAKATLASTRAQIVGANPDTHPRVLQAEANLRTAWLAAARTRVVAPVSGYVVRRAVQLGQQVTPSTEMLAIVPVESVWVDANFKENQLRSLRIGQPVQVSADMYGSRVTYHGKVLGLQAGTGSALAVLPAQNASGNWIKIVQRLPVRVGLDPQELADHPLFVGLSTTVHVDVHDQGGDALSRRPAWQAAVNTDAYADQIAGADADIKTIVANNLGRPTTNLSSTKSPGRLR